MMHSSFVRSTLTTNNITSRLRLALTLALALALGACTRVAAPPLPPAASAVPEQLANATQRCLGCHASAPPALANYMDSASPMMRALSDFDPARSDGLAACRSCHGGSALPVSNTSEAHHGVASYGLLNQFTANPTTDGVVDQVCGVCHRGHLDQLRQSAMERGPAQAAVPACAGACHIMDTTHGGQSGCSVCHSPRLPTAAGAEVFDHRLMGSGKRPMARETLYAGEPTVGVPEAGCLQCHAGGYQVALRFLGAAAPARAGRGYAIDSDLLQPEHADVHRARGLQCQDCHSSYDMHGPEKVIVPDNAVEIECSDCHGTAAMRPWDLPLGYMDAMSDATTARGTAKTVAAIQLHGKPAPRISEFAGYLRSARGTPLKNVIRIGELALLYDTQSIPHAIPPLTERQGHDATTLAQKECYACHARSIVDARRPRLGPNRDGLLAPILQGARYRDGSTLPPAAYTPHDVILK